MTSKTAQRVRELIERRISADELRQALLHPIAENERNETLALVRWFTRRYPTGAERLDYVRRAYARWQRRQATAQP